MPLGASPSQPIQVDAGQTQRPSRSCTMAWQTSKAGPTSGGEITSISLHVCPRSWLRVRISSISV